MRKRDVGDTSNAKVGTIEEACDRYGFGRNKMREIASDAGALIKLGRSVRITMDVYTHIDFSHIQEEVGEIEEKIKIG